MASIKSTSRSLIPEMDHHVKRMLRLIDEDADSFTKKVEMYYQKRPELINLVEEVHRMYRSLAERHDHVTAELLRKSLPSDLQSQCSVITDLGSEPPSTLPSPGPSRRQSGHRAPGLDFFLGTNKGDELESEPESDDYDNCNDEDSERKILTLWEEHMVTREKLHDSEQEVARLRQELASRGFPNLQDHLKIMSKNKTDEDKGEITKLHARYRTNLEDRDDEIRRLKAEIGDKNACIEKLKTNLYQLQQKHDELVDEKDDLNINIFELDQELTSKDDMIDQMSRHIHQLQVEHVETVAGAEATRRTVNDLSSKIKELEREVEKKQKIIDQGAQEKQEAMRQLCFSLEHYRNGYHRLREVVSGQNVMIAS